MAGYGDKDRCLPSRSQTPVGEPEKKVNLCLVDKRNQRGCWEPQCSKEEFPSLGWKICEGWKARAEKPRGLFRELEVVVLQCEALGKKGALRIKGQGEARL
jgi:hypothetical protein